MKFSTVFFLMWICVAFSKKPRVGNQGGDEHDEDKGSHGNSGNELGNGSNGLPGGNRDIEDNNPELEWEMETLNVNKIRVTVTNPTDHTVNFLPWDTVFDHIGDHCVGNPLNVQVGEDQQPATYIGAMAKRVPPSSSDYIPIPRGASLMVIFDVSDCYEMPASDAGGVTNVHVSLRRGNNAAPVTVPVSSNSRAGNLGLLNRAARNETRRGKKLLAGTCAPVSYVSCSASRQTQLIAAHAAVEDWIKKSPVYNDPDPDDSHSESFFGNGGSNLHTVHDGMDDIIDLACQSGSFTGGSVADCSCSDSGVYAWVWTVDPSHTVHYCPVFWSTTDLGRDSRMGTVVHEMSHFNDVGDTDDNVYGCSNTVGYGTTGRSTAESWEHYVEKGCDYSSNCKTEPAGWVDIDGDGCDLYASEDWCGDSNNHEFAVGGIDADEACCECRGGDCSPLRCQDTPNGWADSDGDNCDKYARLGWCAYSWSGTSMYAVGGVNAQMACCACGGGRCR